MAVIDRIEAVRGRLAPGGRLRGLRRRPLGELDVELADECVPVFVGVELVLALLGKGGGGAREVAARGGVLLVGALVDDRLIRRPWQGRRLVVDSRARCVAHPAAVHPIAVHPIAVHPIAVH